MKILFIITLLHVKTLLTFRHVRYYQSENRTGNSCMLIASVISNP